MWAYSATASDSCSHSVPTRTVEQCVGCPEERQWRGLKHGVTQEAEEAGQLDSTDLASEVWVPAGHTPGHALRPLNLGTL